jgi:hypothetical protein
VAATRKKVHIEQPSAFQGYRSESPRKTASLQSLVGVGGADRATVWGMGGEKETVSV